MSVNNLVVLIFVSIERSTFLMSINTNLAQLLVIESPDVFRIILTTSYTVLEAPE